MKENDTLLGFITRLKEMAQWLASPIVRISKKIVLPGFDGIPVYDVSIFFYRGITKSSTNLRASAISFDFIMALAPAVLFLFTVIPYLPIPNLHQTVMATIHSAMPENAFTTIESTIEDIISRSHQGLLSLGFLLSIFFSSNGMITVMRAFNQSVLVTETRSNFKLRLVSLFLVVILVLIVIIAAALQVASYNIIELINNSVSIPGFWFKVMFFFAKYTVFIAILFSVYSFIYYYAPARRGMFRFVSPGSTLATLATIIAIEVFSYFINNFGHYNKIYGSLGTLIVIFLLININALILLIGFELNASIYSARSKKESF
jgi:membrane protein